MDKGWSEANLARVIQFWRDGVTAADIVIHMAGSGLSRTAILGKMKREGIAQGVPVARFAIGSNSRFGRKDRFIFSEEADRLIIREVEAGRSTQAEIAAKVGCKEGAVHTRISLLRKGGHIDPAAKTINRGNLKGGNWAFRNGTPKSQPGVVVAYREKGPDPMAPEPAVDGRGVRYSILTVNDKVCRWPHGDPACGDFHMCGHGVKAGSPYCVYHDRKAHDHSAFRRDDAEAA